LGRIALFLRGELTRKFGGVAYAGIFVAIEAFAVFVVPTVGAVLALGEYDGVFARVVDLDTFFAGDGVAGHAKTWGFVFESILERGVERRQLDQ